MMIVLFKSDRLFVYRHRHTHFLFFALGTRCMQHAGFEKLNRSAAASRYR